MLKTMALMLATCVAILLVSLYLADWDWWPRVLFSPAAWAIVAILIMLVAAMVSAARKAAE